MKLLNNLYVLIDWHLMGSFSLMPAVNQGLGGVVH